MLPDAPRLVGHEAGQATEGIEHCNKDHRLTGLTTIRNNRKVSLIPLVLLVGGNAFINVIFSKTNTFWVLFRYYVFSFQICIGMFQVYPTQNYLHYLPQRHQKTHSVIRAYGKFHQTIVGKNQ